MSRIDIESTGQHRAGVAAVAVAMVASAVGAVMDPRMMCSGNGIVFPDTAPLFPDQPTPPRCECFQCYTGPMCEALNETSCPTVDASVGTEIMAEYWEDHWNDTSLATEIPPYYRAEYQDPDVFPAFDGGQNANTLEAIRRLHARVGNAVTDGRSVLLADGATQVMRLLLGAIATAEGHPMVVTARAPYYPNFEYWGDENPLTATFQRDVSKVDPSHLVEIVTYPNNPDGEYYEPMHPNAKYIIYDVVYYWPHIVPVSRALNHSLMVFSLSKLTGMAASRIGWALIDSATIAFDTIGQQSVETYSVAAEAQFRANRVMAQLSTSHFQYFSTTWAKTAARWAEVKGIFAGAKGRPGRFTLSSAIGFWVWVACNDPKDNCDRVFMRAGIEGRFAHGETGVTRHNRLSVMVRDSTWKILTRRLAALLAEA